MPSGFVATRLSVTEERGVLVTALAAESTQEEDFYLMLQHKDTHTEQDTRLGMDKPYIEYCGQGWSWYGHIERFELSRDRVRIKMDASSASRMRNDGILEVEFHLDEPEFAQLQGALERTFRDVSYFDAKV
jgi:hypothetical protein